jgi:hypothetical protein
MTYTVQFHHGSYSSYNPKYPDVKSIDIHIEAENGDDAVKNARAILGDDWVLRCVLVESE